MITVPIWHTSNGYLLTGFDNSTDAGTCVTLVLVHDASSVVVSPHGTGTVWMVLVNRTDASNGTCTTFSQCIIYADYVYYR